MNAKRNFSIILIGVILFLSAIVGYGQEKVPGEAKPQQTPVPGANSGQGNRPNLFAQLGLTPDQVQQIRRLNIERRPLMEAAQQRLRQANHALDEAIYSEQPAADSAIDECIKEFQAAQAEVAKLRFTNEFAVRKVLTPEQLTRFRNIRRSYEHRRQMMENGQKGGGMMDGKSERPIRKFLRGNQQVRPH